jgi:hypothetical protein
MKKLIIILFFIPLLVNGQSWNDLKKVAKKVNTEIVNNRLFSEEEAVNALKETLNNGTEKGVKLLSEKDGYFANKDVKIPFPEKANKVAKKLQQLGMQKEIDQIVLLINRAAEDAALSAKPIFTEAIKDMNIHDAISIVKGNKTSGTDYLNKSTNKKLNSVIKPIIKISLDKVNATKYWEITMETYNKIPFIEKINPELDTYVTQKAIEGLFYMLAQKEIAIRENPRERTSTLLKKVFGS